MRQPRPSHTAWPRVGVHRKECSSLYPYSFRSSLWVLLVSGFEAYVNYFPNLNYTSRMWVKLPTPRSREVRAFVSLEPS